MFRVLKLSGALALLLALNTKVSADETKGRVKSVDTGRNEIVLKGTLNNTMYLLKSDGTVWIDGARSKLTDLKVDDEAIVLYEKSGDHNMASQVRILRSAKETTGTVKDVLAEKNEITIKGTIKNSTYELVKGGTVWVNSQKASLSDIRETDEVLITYEERGDRLMANDVTVLRRRSN